MKLAAASVLASAVSAQYLPAFAAPAAPIYTPYAQYAPAMYAGPVARAAAPVIRRLPVTLAAPAPVAPDPAEEVVETGPSIEDSFKDWNIVRKDYLFADAYGDSYSMFTNYVYGPSSSTSASTQQDRADLKWANFANAYFTAQGNLKDQLQQAYMDGADQETIWGLQQGITQTGLFGMTGLSALKGWEHTGKLATMGRLVGVQVAQAGLDGSAAAQGAYDSANAWFLGTGLGWKGKPTQSSEVLAMAMAIDAQNAERDLWDAEDAYFANPTAANARALEIAEITYDALAVQVFGGLAGISSSLGDKLGGNFGPLMFAYTYNRLREAADMALMDATDEFVATHGINPYAYLGGRY